jgi:hypothetical protein
MNYSFNYGYRFNIISVVVKPTLLEEFQRLEFLSRTSLAEREREKERAEQRPS